jgi:hypothetical protein
MSSFLVVTLEAAHDILFAMLVDCGLFPASMSRSMPVMVDILRITLRVVLSLRDIIPNSRQSFE